MRPGSSRSRAAARWPRSCSTGCAIQPFRNRCAAWSISAIRPPVCQFSFVCDGALYRVPTRARGSRPKLSLAAALAGYVEQRSDRRPIITPIMSRRVGRRADQDHQDRRAYLLSLAGRLGPAGRRSTAATSASRATRGAAAAAASRRSRPGISRCRSRAMPLRRSADRPRRRTTLAACSTRRRAGR